MLFPELEATEPLSAKIAGLGEKGLTSIALNLGARALAGWSVSEEQVCRDLPNIAKEIVDEVRAAIVSGEDPLGEAFCRVRSPLVRRPQGAIFTPLAIVKSMLASLGPVQPVRMIDAGIGSGRFAIHAGKLFPKASIIGFEIDPVAAILGRANLAVSGLAARAEILLADYRYASVPRLMGPTLFVGNPPYVRHHLLDPRGKRWLTDHAAKLGLSASQLAGLLRALLFGHGPESLARGFRNLHHGCRMVGSQLRKTRQRIVSRTPWRKGDYRCRTQGTSVSGCRYDRGSRFF
jgi:N-6 DNA Methylase